MPTVLAQLHDDRTLGRAWAPRALIDVAMTVSATAALVPIAIWFFFYSAIWLVNPL